ncbi:hypothetical protein HanPI659440_Chr04g0177161 [Helianthus annuus]|nr:hypothetical protein HanPI659440_Chr04g0177161 [Helianthus annuus]
MEALLDEEFEAKLMVQVAKMNFNVFEHYVEFDKGIAILSFLIDSSTSLYFIIAFVLCFKALFSLIKVVLTTFLGKPAMEFHYSKTKYWSSSSTSYLGHRSSPLVDDTEFHRLRHRRICSEWNLYPKSCISYSSE